MVDSARCLLERHKTVVESPGMLEIFYRNYLGTPMAICFTDPEGTIIDANDSFLNLYGYGIDEVKGKNPRILKSGRQSPAVYQELWQAITDKNIGFWSGEIINRKNSGEDAYVILTISSVFRPDQTLIGYVASTIDITDRKEMELKLKDRNEELERLSQFKSDIMSVTSHDLKAPLNAILSYAILLRENIGSIPPNKQLEYLDKILAYGGNMSKFINDILDLRMVETGRFKVSPGRSQLDAVLRSCVELNEAAGSAKEISIRLACTGRRRKAVADVMKMEQVFNNLLSNAVKFSPSRGTIQVTYDDDGSGALKICIQDQGPGIPEKDLPHIFDSYYQVERKDAAAKRSFGVGLGLSIVRNIMELHHGSVCVESLPERGCRFTLRLPLKTVTGYSCLAVLIIDPRSSIFEYLEPAARAREIACFTVMNAHEAQRTHAYESPDVIFVSREDLSEEITDFLCDVKREDPACSIVTIQNPGRLSDDPIGTPLLQPISTEVVDAFLDDVLRTLQGEASNS